MQLSDWSYTYPSFTLFSHIIEVAVFMAKLFGTLISHYQTLGDGSSGSDQSFSI